ncbi:MAG: saccharopine dehydrogenase [bacterium]|nr:saccharopine dehydrogenase [bacterium]
MKKIIVLGAGLVGKAMAIDLCRNYHVTSVDINPDVLDEASANHPIRTLTANVSDPQTLKNVIADSDLVIGAVPGFMGFEMLKTVIECGKNIVDISFFPDDPFELDELAKAKNVTAVVDCGVAPGMSNAVLGYHNERMAIDRFACYVGGLSIIRTWPFEYKAPFSPIDVIAEYTRPARIMENNRIVVKPALSDSELIEFENIGTLEAFNTDGLRTLLTTMPIPDMKEKTLRYPGQHLNAMRILREIGLFDETPIEVEGVLVRPIDITAKLIFPKWKLEKHEEEFTVMRVVIEGKEDGQKKKYEYHLLDRYDTHTDTSSMARTTGYTCTAAASLLLENHFTRKGICPPEYLGATEGCLEKMMNYFEERNIRYKVKRIDD